MTEIKLNRFKIKLRKLIISILKTKFISQWSLLYRTYLKWEFGVDKPSGLPKTCEENAVLKTRRDWENAVKQAKMLGLPIYEEKSKNWDSLAALDCILRRFDSTAYILDAGAELYSVILPWLFLYGYKYLIGINLAFKQSVRHGLIQYEYGDITQTRFKDNTFDAITCLSVIEHGVDIHAYFKEMSRILKPGGILITSTDYYDSPIDTEGLTAYGVPIHIFLKDEIIQIFNIAQEFELYLTSPIDLDCQEKAVTWRRFSLDYTFLIFTLQKKS